jgi:renalase
MRRAGFYVEMFEQERIIGGRIATVRQGLNAFDHGAQYVSARGPAFGAFLADVAAAGYAARWQPRTNETGEDGLQMQPWYVGTPGMASIVRPLAEGLRIHTGRRVHTITRVEKSWHVWFDDQTSSGPFAAIAIAVPAPQARLMLGPMEEMAQSLSRARMMPCWALTVHLDKQALPNQDVFSDMSEVVRWVARNSHKPGRSAHGETIVVHASPGYSRESEDVEPEVIATEIWAEVCRALQLGHVEPRSMHAHLWRHGLVDQSLGESYVYSSQHLVGVAGDWCLGRLAEHAYDSGQMLGKAIVSSL